MATTYKLGLEKLGGTDAEDFIGKIGDVWFDPEEAIEDGLVLRVSDGETEGGIPTTVGGGGSAPPQEMVMAPEGGVFANNPQHGTRYSVFEGDTFTLTVQTNISGNVSAGYEIDVAVAPTGQFVITSYQGAFSLNDALTDTQATTLEYSGPNFVKVQKLYNDVWVVTGRMDP